MRTRVTQRGIVVPVLDDLEHPAGVYLISSSRFPDGVYVGSTYHLQQRAHEHWRDAQKRVCQPRLQALFDAGLDAAQFMVLEYFPEGSRYSRDLLDAEERHAVKYHVEGRLLSDHLAYKWSNIQRAKVAAPSTRKSIELRIATLERRLSFLRYQLTALDSPE